MITLRQLEYLLAIGDTRNFHRAADRVGASQSTISGQLKALEQALGVKVFERDRQRVLVTPAGREVLEHARRILDLVGELKDAAQREGAGLGGTLRLGTLPTVGPYILPRVVPELHRRHPDLRLYVREALPTQLESALLAGEHDALLVPLPVPTGVTENIPLYREPLLVGMGADHPLAAKQKIDKEDLVGREVLALEPGHRLFEQVRHLCMDYGAKLRLDYEGTSLDTLRLMLGMGMGISFLPALYVASELAKDPACVARPMSGASPQRLIGLVWRKTSSRLTAIEALADTMRHVVVLAEIPGVEATGGRKAEEPEAAALEN